MEVELQILGESAVRGNGSDDPAPLVAALRMLEADSLLRTPLGEAGREAVRIKFRQETVIENLSALYEMLADRRPAAALMRADG